MALTAKTHVLILLGIFLKVTSLSSQHIQKIGAASTPDRWSSQSRSGLHSTKSKTSNLLLQTFFKHNPVNPHDEDKDEVDFRPYFKDTKKNIRALDYGRGDIDLSDDSKKVDLNSNGTDYYVVPAASPVEQFFAVIKGGFQLILMFIIGNMMTVFNPFGLFFPYEP